TIRPNYRFSNGTKVTANDVKFSIDRELTIFPQSSRAPMRWTNIKGATAVENGHAMTASGLVAHGNKLIVNLVRPDGALPVKLANPLFCILSSGTTPMDPNNPASNPVTAGPYHATQDAAHRIVLRRNPYYTGPRPQHLSSIVFTGGGGDSALTQVASNHADLAYPDDSNAATLARRYGARLKALREPFTWFVVLNTHRGAFRSQALRRAASFAIDRPAMIRAAAPGSATPTGQILPPGMPGYRRLRVYRLNGPNFAKANRIRRNGGKRCGPVTL